MACSCQAPRPRHWPSRAWGEVSPPRTSGRAGAGRLHHLLLTGSPLQLLDHAHPHRWGGGAKGCTGAPLHVAGCLAGAVPWSGMSSEGVGCVRPATKAAVGVVEQLQGQTCLTKPTYICEEVPGTPCPPEDVPDQGTATAKHPAAYDSAPTQPCTAEPRVCWRACALQLAAPSPCRQVGAPLQAGTQAVPCTSSPPGGTDQQGAAALARVSADVQACSQAVPPSSFCRSCWALPLAGPTAGASCAGRCGLIVACRYWQAAGLAAGGLQQPASSSSPPAAAKAAQLTPPALRRQWCQLWAALVEHSCHCARCRVHWRAFRARHAPGGLACARPAAGHLQPLQAGLCACAGRCLDHHQQCA